MKLKLITYLLLFIFALILGGSLLGFKLLFNASFTDLLLVALAYFVAVISWIKWGVSRSINADDPKYHYMRDEE